MVQPVTALVGAANNQSDFDDLHAALARLRRKDLSESQVDQVAIEVIELRRLVDGLELEWNRRVAHLTDVGRSGLEGHSSVTAWLKHQCRMSGARAHRAVVLSSQLRKLPFVSKAFEGDDLSFDQIQVLAQIPDHLSEELAGDEVSLVNAVGELSVADTRRVVEYWKTAVDGPGCAASAEELAAQRYLFAAR